MRSQGHRRPRRRIRSEGLRAMTTQIGGTLNATQEPCRFAIQELHGILAFALSTEYTLRRSLA